jgi:hypothetical protein
VCHKDIARGCKSHPNEPSSGVFAADEARGMKAASLLHAAMAKG